ncbi:hypothetical protein ACFVUS_19850 [Nocardia sp. NPDC058058]|uniref:hypothetical protein n=1 Tax=Nocardia sp. NPDC058058 TaxID=3346317 RepID=UPI0036DE22D1
MAMLANLLGQWSGANDFRLMPTDTMQTSAATVTVTFGAGGNLASIGYTWSHPADGPQQGLLVVGADEDGNAQALWSDTWHQKPGPQVLTGTARPGAQVELSATYGGDWEWRIMVDDTVDGVFRLRMDNVVPESYKPGVGAYTVMELTAHRV